MLSNKNPIVTELFIRGRKLSISLVFMIQSYFAVPKNIRLNPTHYFIMEIPNKLELQQINNNFMNLFKNVLQSHVLYYLLMLLLHQINLHISERIS